jgi:glycosyltransferase involved in cell wall biosynthesis
MRIVCVTPHVPHAGVRHAGGQYLWRHLSALTAHEICVVAPRTQVNEQALHEHHGQTILVNIGESSMHRLTAAGLRAFRPLRPDKDFESILVKGRGRNLLRKADVVELHWPENIGLVPLVRKVTAAKIVAVPHDILVQRFDREALHGTPVRSLRAKAIRGSVRSAEAVAYAEADRTIVFSTKDAALVREFAPTAKVEVVDPPVASVEKLSLFRSSRRESGQAKSVLFTGAFSRDVNEDAAIWLIQDIWPLVQRRCPQLTLQIVGSGATKRMYNAAANSANVTIVGEVASFDQFYLDASVFVAPLRAGAGVKIKCIEALAAGVPVVGTSIAAEGIPEGLFFRIRDDIVELVNAIVDAAASESKATQGGRDLSRFTFEAHRQRVSDIYAGLSGGE